MTLKQIETMLGVIGKRKNQESMFMAKVHGATFNLPDANVKPIDKKTEDLLDKRMEEIMARRKNGK